MNAYTLNPAVNGKPRYRICTKGPSHWFVERLTTHGWERVQEDNGSEYACRLIPFARSTERDCEDWIGGELVAYDAELAKELAIKNHIKAHPPREYP
ncbi:hypothetical protein EV561_10144 [Rhizobium sp. BK376]|nr:hypothetical protein EV561_10144 [Rhizobium sp. BK376]